VKAPVLGLYGAEDASIPPDQVEAMKEKLEAAGKTAKFKIYPGAGHGFFADYRQKLSRRRGARCLDDNAGLVQEYGVLD